MRNLENSILYNKSFSFSLKIIDLYKDITFQKKEFVMSKQLLRSSTSIGANICEASEAQSLKDFISKLYISLKESREAQYWLKLLIHSNFIDTNTGNTLISNLDEIRAILISSIKTSKLKLVR